MSLKVGATDVAAVYVGATEASTVYFGATQVWGFSPASISGLALWLDAQQITGLADGAAVNTWNDASGAGHNAVAIDSPAVPVYKTAGVNGHPSVLFTGSSAASQRLQIGGLATALSGKTAYTMFVVATPRTLSMLPIVMSSPINAVYQWFTEFGTSGVYWGHTNNHYRLYTAGIGVNVPQRLDYWFVAGVPRFYRNSVEITAFTKPSGIDMDASVPVLPGTDVLLGGYWNKSLGFDGWLGELIWYDHAISSSELVLVQKYLQAKWGF